ncbi:MAG: hypothetical protein ACN6OB_03935 [Chryseobacterium jejuense]|uniref:hypothetical protein n=1 Tax=Chryseobacterium jejuense TaxID=445960 RepID=UPI003D1349A4
MTRSNNSNDKFIITNIKASFDGTILKKVDVRKNLFSHVIISRNNKADTLIFIGEYTDSVNIGDRIIKHKDSPFFYAVSNGKSSRKYIFELIPEPIFNNDKFPQAWKDSCKGNWKEAVAHE